MAGNKKTTTSTVVVQKTKTTRTVKSTISNKAPILIVNQIVTSESQKQSVKGLKSDKNAQLCFQLQESQREANQLRAQLEESQRETAQLRIKQDKVDKSLTRLLKSQKSCKRPKRLN